ncbi:18814_t:CDS:2 [Entrophospora sp. SA101]|nr:18814_t:CDS:2 [Entrophospora sp. SA101]
MYARNRSFFTAIKTKKALQIPIPPPPHRPNSPPKSSLLLRNLVIGTSGLVGLTLFLKYYYSDSRAVIHKYLSTTALRLFTTPETSHKFAIWAAKHELTPKDKLADDECLGIEVWGKKISNPIGLAAGFDKNGEAIDGLFDLGFGYVEIGSVTPEPQPGNPKPRVFRLSKDKSIINRYGFNSDGHYIVESRLRDRIRRKSNGKRGINLGKNKWSDVESVDDYVKGIKRFGEYADILVVNVSSPNTPGLRGLQKKGLIDNLLKEVMKALKISPDLTEEELEDIADAAMNNGVDGIIISNTTTSRPASLKSDKKLISEMGGLSGPPVKQLSLRALKKIYQYTNGKIVLIGCGGISNAQDALEYARAGATMVQLYTSLTYDGAGKVREIKDGVIKELNSSDNDGDDNKKKWKDIVGEYWRESHDK